jgi:hypothetical protein
VQPKKSAATPTNGINKKEMAGSFQKKDNMSGKTDGRAQNGTTHTYCWS